MMTIKTLSVFIDIVDRIIAWPLALILFFVCGFMAGTHFERERHFVCPPEYNCLIGKNGNSVLVEQSVSVIPGTGSIGVMGQ